MAGNKAKFSSILTKTKDLAVRLDSCGKGGQSGPPRFGDQGAHHMTDSTEPSPSLADLFAACETAAELLDWDTSALADWPNITPNVPAISSTAEPQAGEA